MGQKMADTGRLIGSVGLETTWGDAIKRRLIGGYDKEKKGE